MKRKTRADKAEIGTARIVKDKFMEQRLTKVKPLVAMNRKQQEYIDLLNDKNIIIATGYAGTSKTYIPTVMAADLYKLNQINKIIVTRPAVSESKSLGFYSGDVNQKMQVWLGAVLPIFNERLGKAQFEIALSSGDIEFMPLETIKGTSVNNAWLLVEESSDLTKEELIKIITRMGKNSKLVLSGDIRQSEMNKGSGFTWLVDFVKRHKLQDNFGFIDFGDVNDIVRSDAVKEFITAIVRDERQSKGLRKED
jgi:phosphate starvation-inducible PhoH-like protein